MTVAARSLLLLLLLCGWACASIPPQTPSPEPSSSPSESPSPTSPTSDSPAPSPTLAPIPRPSASPSLAPALPRPTPKPGGSPAATSRLPKILQEVEAKYSKSATLQAEFTQVNDIAALKTKKTSSGHIMIKRPDKLRWETTKPDMNLLVSDGHHFWFYTPPFDEGEHGQVIEKKAAKSTPSSSMRCSRADFRSPLT